MVKQVKATCSALSCASTITMILTLPLGYPDIPPKISVITRDFDNEILIEMKEDVENHAQLLLGQPMLMNLIMKLEESVSSCMLSRKISCGSCIKARQKSQEMGTVSNRGTEESDCWISLLQIDHMRSKSSYIKTLSQWTKELDLCGRLLFYDWLILLVLQGDLKDIKVGCFDDGCQRLFKARIIKLIILVLLLPAKASVSSSLFTSIVHAFICSRIDYCNSLHVGLAKVRHLLYSLYLM